MRILVVEDEPLLAKSIKKGLMDEDYAVDVFYNGRQAYEQAAIEEYDLILLDIMLPDMDGFTIAKQLRIDKVKTPIIFLTAKDTTKDKITGLDLGGDDYLIKPFSFEELLARIRSVIRRSTTNELILTIESLELNPTTHIVKRKNKEIVLTGKEYALLEYLMRHPNQILTKEQILNHVWDYSFDPMSNIIEVMIKRLRSKIDKDFPQEKELFHTTRGLGYKIGD
jgi:two-component system copper resistance phosphate regulon response regulator CusR